ncbi:MAG: phosphatidylserine decarboxylase [Elusimicrobia bacterium RIFCSPLOWO2_02_FULL_39_32]|nr:MAG: phosphatidylserine decarboxylase [Elusimicrobia bacterium GWA2_38_7]OGR80866.1 MAG: phosphatidylserine decarboxylase [Elusimicrobia bacterium RIFCSPHIGHO2_02_FULL_39_36]OGR93745.1 MAG: phosphatidylserine decarboxylase [Elusimicrobia bacterium RIFCSPLOWO2_02_FULL_39_32]OGS00961.1 MAG: phosphatidylserine decarboxylase [Elusimicrobia bacterium RIFCSPLOWO2_12_FULL_39_28]
MPKRASKLPVAKEGFPFILGFCIAGFIFVLIPFVFFRFLSLSSFLLATFCIYFFRDPEREVPQDSTILLSPGDGKVLEVSEESSPYFEGKAKVIKIFLSIFDVHIQRAPMAGKILRIDYQKGKFLDARNPRAAYENENNVIVIQTKKSKMVVKQIAGLIARRIACWVQMGEEIEAGQKLGLIRFGSQVNLILPMDVEVCVSPGERLIGGVSVVALHK